MVRALKELDADIHQADHQGRAALFSAAMRGHTDVVRCLDGEFGANVNQTNHAGVTPLMAASSYKHDKVIRWLTNHGANVKASSKFRTAVDFSRTAGAPAEQIAYLEAKAHCSNYGCDGAGLRKCQGCKEVHYCGVECGLAHWAVHKAE
jgi:ankyrin repeat protein